MIIALVCLVSPSFAADPFQLDGAPEIVLSDREGWYGRTEFFHSDIKDNIGWVGGLGYQWGHAWRADLTGHYNSENQDKIANIGEESFAQSHILANAYWDLGSLEGFTPYLGGGLGIAYVRSATTIGTQTTRVLQITTKDFSYAFHSGVSVDISDKMKLDIGYSYIAVGDNNSQDDHAFRIGMRHLFWE